MDSLSVSAASISRRACKREARGDGQREMMMMIVIPLSFHVWYRPVTSSADSSGLAYSKCENKMYALSTHNMHYYCNIIVIL